MTIWGFVVYGAALTVYPFMESIYPGILCISIASKVLGQVFITNTPFLADYVSRQSMGGTVALTAAVEKTAVAVVNTGYIWFQDKYDIGFSYFFVGTGALTIVGVFVTGFCLKEVAIKKEKKD